MIPTGTYVADIIDAVTTVTKNNTPCIEIHISVNEPTPKREIDHALPVMRTLYIYLSEAAKQTSREKLQSLGFNGNFDAPEFTASELLVKCIHETNPATGMPREKWELGSWKSPSQRAGDAIVRSLNSWWNGGTSPQGSTRPAVPPQAGDSTRSLDDDIPF